MGHGRRLTLALALGLALRGVCAAADARVDPRLELLNVVQRLAQDDGLSSGIDVSQWIEPFSRYRSHPAVRLYKKMMRTGFRGGVATQWLFQVGPLPDLPDRLPMSDFFLSRAGGREQLEQFKRKLADFDRVSRFSRRRSAWAAADAELERAAQAALRAQDVEEGLERTMGVRTWSSLNVYVSVLFPQLASAAWVVELSTGRPEIDVLAGPVIHTVGPVVYDFGEPAGFVGAVWREAIFSTAYIMVEVCRDGLQFSPTVCGGDSFLRDAEDCAEARWVDAISARALRRLFGARAERSAAPLESSAGASLLRAFDEFDGARGSTGDVVASAGSFFAPFVAPGRGPSCSVFERRRLTEQLYPRRLLWYFDGLLARRRSPLVLARRAVVRESLGDAVGARADLTEALSLMPPDDPDRPSWQEELDRLAPAP